MVSKTSRRCGAYVQRLNRLHQASASLPSLIQNDFPLERGRICLMDSMPAVTADTRRSSRAEAAREIADKGYNAVKDGMVLRHQVPCPCWPEKRTASSV